MLAAIRYIGKYDYFLIDYSNKKYLIKISEFLLSRNVVYLYLYKGTAFDSNKNGFTIIDSLEISIKDLKNPVTKGLKTIRNSLFLMRLLSPVLFIFFYIFNLYYIFAPNSSILYILYILIFMYIAVNYFIKYQICRSKDKVFRYNNKEFDYRDTRLEMHIINEEVEDGKFDIE